MAQPLNLLRHPRRVHALELELGRAALAALVVGSLIGCAWGMWQQRQQDQLQLQRAHLQAQSRDLLAQQARQTAAQDTARLQLHWRQRAQSWQSHRQQVMRLQTALMAQASATGLRVERWQADGRQLVLQAWLPRAERVPEVISGLSQAWASGWHLQSMAHRTDSGVDVVLQAAWPAGIKTDGQSKP